MTALQSLLCHETLERRPKILCEGCERLEIGKETTLFRPIRLEHLAIVAVLRSFDIFRRSSVEGESYALFKRIVTKMVNARYYLVEYDSGAYAQVSRLIELIELKYAQGHHISINFSYIEPICCCVAKLTCFEFPYKHDCPNMKRWRYHKFRFFDMHNSHRVNRVACCCDGMRTTYCNKSGYILSKPG